MGRAEPSVGKPPASFHRDARAKRAKATINQLIPSLLSTHPRARKGIEETELILEPQLVHKDEKGPSSNDATGPRLLLRVADTLTTARSLLATDAFIDRVPGVISDKPKVAILNMASPLSPGGGFLNGASSQEESLCMRTTLLPSLKDEYYRLPELGAVYTPDVLVFRDEGSEEVLPKADRYFVDCITAAMLRSPELERNEGGWTTYMQEKDRELVLGKMRAVMRICELKRVTHIVLGAWGCGAYGNPVNEVASAWYKVLCPRQNLKSKGKKQRESWPGVKVIVFAIKDAGMAESFETAFGKGLQREVSGDMEPVSEGEDEDDGEEETRKWLRERIRELEARIQTCTSPIVKEGLWAVQISLIKQLRDKE